MLNRIANWICCGILVCALPAWAEKADRDKPMQIEADSMTADGAAKVTTFTGNVLMNQGTLRLKADRIVVRQDTDGFQHSSAWGNPVSFRQKREGLDEYIEGYARRIEHDGKADILRLFEQARLKRQQDDIRGSAITYNATTEFYQVDSGASAVTANNPQGRVRAVIQPKDKKAVPNTSLGAALQPSGRIAHPREE